MTGLTSCRFGFSQMTYPGYATSYNRGGQAGQSNPMFYPPGMSSVQSNPLQSIQQVTWSPAAPVWQNRLKKMFHNRQAVIYALHLRTFAAVDKNGDGKIDPALGENGTFLKAIQRLPELKAMGVNTIHLLPILPIGRLDRLGEFGSPGSAYSPLAYDRLNEEYTEPGSPYTLVQQARMFVDACHQMGIHVMVDIPSCASVDLARLRPDLLARDAKGRPLTPTNWVDIRMFKKDSPELRAYFQKFFDLMVNQLNVDGFRADIARARTMDFWRYFIGKYPHLGWLAETYTEEDASPMKNLPRDLPEDLLKAGFDSFYGQYHITHEMDATQLIRYTLQNRAMFNRVGTQKSVIGSMLTHDDPSIMDQGGVLYSLLASGLMTTLPDMNPYILDGFTTGYDKHFDIFNYKPRPTGRHPEIGRFLQQMLAIRSRPPYGPLLTVGDYQPLHVEQDKKFPRVIAFLRKLGNRTVLIVANKDVNAAHEARIQIPGLKRTQSLKNIAPAYGEVSRFTVQDHQLDVKLARGRFYMFELDLAPVTKH